MQSYASEREPSLPSVDTALAARVKSEFTRRTAVDVGNVQMEVADGRVILRGQVRSQTEKQDASRAALMTPGVTHVDNKLVVSLTD